MTGQQLFDKVFAKEIEEHGWLNLYEIDEIDGVTCYNEELSYREEWYAYYEVTIRYEGKKYSFTFRTHVSPNVSDTDYDMDSFSEVLSVSNLHKKIDRIIKSIEDETVGTWEEVIADLEKIKREHE